jgi:hypothetical protein
MGKLNWIIILLVLIAYLMPLLIVSASPLSMTSYDLAEWLSLAPSQRTASIPLIVPFLLRVQPVIISLLFLINLQHVKYRKAILGILVVAQLALLPPLEFFSTPNDPNYQQQLFITLLGIIVLIICQIFTDYAKNISLPLSIGALVSLGYVVTIATPIFTDYRLTTSFGLGLIGMVIGYSLLVLQDTRKIIQDYRQ